MTEQHQPLGLVEDLTPFRIRGWAFDRNQPGLAVDLALRVDGTVVHCFRPHLMANNIAHYLHWPADRLGPTGFDIAAPEILSDGRKHQVEVVHLASGKILAGTPCFVRHQSSHAPLGAWKIRDKERLANAKPNPLVSIVVLNRNGQNVLQALLESWQQHNRYAAVEWIVIDHASTDGSLVMLRRWARKLTLNLQALSNNNSFSASCNLGAQLAQGEYLFFLNNDIVWIEDALPALLQPLQQDANIGVVGMKLLKTHPIQDTGATTAWTEVQHLGVRFKASHHGYWPYEATPSLIQQEAQYTSQQVPAVTGAALLCRKSDFQAAGGFDPAYFYGFEDVEFCVRLSQRLGKRIVCRNDLAALHHHGHSRLTGREKNIFDRIQHNAHILNQHLGLWVKFAWWHSLLTADHNLSSERLTIGLQVNQLPSLRQQGRVPPSRQQQATSQLAAQLQQRFGHAQIVLVHPGINPHDARGLHVLVATSPDYDVRLLQNKRADLRCIAYVTGQPKIWMQTDCWTEYDGYVTPQSRIAKTLSHSGTVAADTSTPTHPLGRWLQAPPAAHSATHQPLRIAIHLPSTPSASTDKHTATLEAASQLQSKLKQQGAACWLAADHMVTVQRMVHIHIHLLAPKRTRSTPALDLDPGCLNIVWQLQAPPNKLRLNTTPHSAPPDLWLHTMPTLDEIHQALEKRLGHTFSAP